MSKHPQPSASPLLECVVVSAPDPTACVIWLHGLGADGHDFEPIVPYLGLPRGLGIRFVFPHAPRQSVTLNHGMVMRAWYDIGFDFDRNHDEPGVRRSAAHIEALVAAEEQRGFPRSRIVLAGFSQGAAMAYHVGLRATQPFAGILVLSGYLLLGDRLMAEASPSARQTPILQCHGTQDPVVPYALGHESARLVRAAGFPVEWREYPVAHNVSAEETRDVGAWLGRLLGG